MDGGPPSASRPRHAGRWPRMEFSEFAESLRLARPPRRAWLDGTHAAGARCPDYCVGSMRRLCHASRLGADAYFLALRWPSMMASSAPLASRSGCPSRLRWILA